MVAEKFPRLDALFTPTAEVAVARIVFQGSNPLEWFSVVMKWDGEAFTAALPQPKKSLKSFRYYVEVTDRAAGTTRTEEYTTSVGETASACKGKMTAVALAAATVLLSAPAGAIVPAGFATVGVASASAAAAGAAAGAVGGGGLSAGATAGLVGGAGAVAAVALGAGAGNSATNTAATPTPTPVPVCRLTLSTSPDQPTTGNGRFCTITAVFSTGGVQAPVSGQQTLSVACNSRVELTAMTAGTYAEWGADCRGSALGVPCFLNPIGTDRMVTLTCHAVAP